ncbi:cytochrome P450 [Mycena floridula]|nr:cytochrome P450 [Mycena floridula]
MPMSPTATLVVSGFTCYLLFNRLEPRNPWVIVGLCLVPPALLSVFAFQPFGASTVNVLYSFVIFHSTLIIATCIYRLSPLHPLAKYPGPVLFKLSRLAAWYLVRRGDQHKYYRALHERYGPYIRTGPNHIHTSDAAAIRPVMVSRDFSKGERYSVMKGPVSLIGIADHQEHAQRRRAWDNGLNPSAIKNYKEALDERTSQLVSHLEKREGTVVDLGMWLSLFSLDFMGDMAFGGAFNTMEAEGDHLGVMEVLAIAIHAQEVAGTIPWIKGFYELLPVSVLQKQFGGISRDTLLARMKRGAGTEDLLSHMLDERGTGEQALTFPTLVAESRLALAAGSDTTAVTLCNLFTYLMTHPAAYSKLQKEVDAALLEDDLAKLPYLNAVINETLRIMPVVPNGIQRVLSAGSQGCTIGGNYIPPSTVVQVAPSSLIKLIVHRNPAHFNPSPESFIPERWIYAENNSIDDPEMTALFSSSEFRLDKSAYFPWSLGPGNCAGKWLAVMEMREVVFALIAHFDFEPEGTADWEGWENRLKDRYLVIRDLPILVKVRIRPN